MHKVEKPSELARSMVADKLYIAVCCARSVSLPGMSLVYHHITVVEIVNVATEFGTPLAFSFLNTVFRTEWLDNQF